LVQVDLEGLVFQPESELEMQMELDQEVLKSKF
jgi:hypothetical protein